jgi:hypothetical protein
LVSFSAHDHFCFKTSLPKRVITLGGTAIKDEFLVTNYPQSKNKRHLATQLTICVCEEDRLDGHLVIYKNYYTHHINQSKWFFLISGNKGETLHGIATQ